MLIKSRVKEGREKLGVTLSKSVLSDLRLYKSELDRISGADNNISDVIEDMLIALMAKDTSFQAVKKAGTNGAGDHRGQTD